MVRPLLIGAALAWAGAAHAQDLDWSRAGGALFAQAAASPDPTQAVEAATAVPALRQPYADEVAAAAARYGIDPKLLHAVVAVESGYHPDAVSRVGAAGLTQLMPATAAELAVRDRFDAGENLLAGAAHLARQMRRFGDLRLALAAYNAGPEHVAALGRAPDIPETRHYVDSVIECFLALTVGRGVRSAKDCRAQGAGE